MLGDILTYTYETRTGVNLLFRGASGYGKTQLSKGCCNFLVGNNYQTCLGNNVKFDNNIWVHFIDEVHLLPQPEILYPIMDSGIYVFVFATNFDSLLPEAFTNRCTNFVFTDYSDSELTDIFKFHSKLKFTNSVIKYIIDASGRNPRVMVRTFINTLYMHYYKNQDELMHKSDEEIINEIDALFGISGGLNRICRHYLETLQKLGGRTSINLLCSAANLDQNTVKYEIEPVLIYKNLLKITSRGRELI